jgi:hypothetical protein
VSNQGGESAWVVIGTIAAVLTLAVTVYLAAREGIVRRAQQSRDALAALDGLDRELRLLEDDARRAIASITAMPPAVPGFRLRVDELAEYLEAARDELAAEQREAIDYVLRQATDSNRAMDAAQAVPDGTGDRIRQYQLVLLKAGHLFEPNEHGVLHLQRAQNAVVAARRKHQNGVKL